MKVLILYRPMSEHGRVTEEFIRDFQIRNHGIQIETQSIDTRDGSATASLYDVIRYPAILVTEQDGRLVHCWMGEELPLMDEVASYAVL